MMVGVNGGRRTWRRATARVPCTTKQVVSCRNISEFEALVAYYVDMCEGCDSNSFPLSLWVALGGLLGRAGALYV